MKKISIVFITILLLIVAILPVIGNRFMQNRVNDALMQANAYGLKLQSMKTDATYLDTKKHLEFVIEDATEFIGYINSHAHKQLPTLTASKLNGTLIGLDVAYSNIPFTKSIQLDIYPLKLSKTLQDSLESEDVHFYNKLSAFLAAKGVLCHIDYNLLNSQFKGSLKDIDERYKLHNGSDVTLQLLGTKFRGEGDLLSAKSFHSQIKTVRLEATKQREYALLALENFQAKNSFLSFENYSSAVALQKIQFLIDGTKKDVNISVSNFKTSSDALTKKERVTIDAKTAFDALNISAKKVALAVKKFHSDISVKGLAQKPFEAISTILNKTTNIKAMANKKEMQEAMLNLLAKGLQITIKDISVADVVIDKNEHYGASKLNLDMVVNADENLSKKVKIAPMELLADLKLDANTSVSQRVYDKLVQSVPMASLLSLYAKKEQKDVVFNLQVHNSKIYLNGKQIQ
ncbi:hypothetical protein MNB_SM-5-870 [hydrothermal vent metagenome]|uniref:Uncharacterized protein n=1 Tax=hydrothermal vent metagenome TaxID=652676 RepID=A0A1W1C969_9ZZZZ